MKNSISVKDKAKKFESVLVTLDSLTSIGFKFQDSKHVSSKGPAGESYEFLLSGDNDVSVEFTFYPAFGDKSDYNSGDSLLIYPAHAGNLGVHTVAS